VSRSPFFETIVTVEPMTAGFAASVSDGLLAVEREREVGFLRFCALAVDPENRERIRMAMRVFIDYEP
jgi:hypothetical protein